MKLIIALLACAFCLLSAAHADDLFGYTPWAHVASDRTASAVGDILTVVVYQNAEARNAAQNAGGKHRSAEARIRSNAIDEGGALVWGGDYTGRGEIRRSESLVTQISVVIEDVLPNGDLAIAGEQLMFVNGEETTIRVRGRVRAIDITHDNRVLSTRIADAEINYNGQGFVSRNARPGIVHRLFSLLGLGG